MNTIENTICIYSEFERLVREILSEQEIEDLSQAPGKELGEKVTQDELNYMLAYIALARSGKSFNPEEGEVFRLWAKKAIRKASKKIELNRRLALLHIAIVKSNFERRNLPIFFITLFEQDEF